MKPFTLTKVLKYRKQMEDVAALQLAHAQQQLQIAQRDLEKVENDLRRLITDLDTFQEVGISIEKLMCFENRISWLKKEREKYTAIFESALENANTKRSIVLEKSKNKKILEKLKKKQDQQWHKYQNKRENDILDEIAVFSHEKQHNQNS